MLKKHGGHYAKKQSLEYNRPTIYPMSYTAPETTLGVTQHVELPRE